MANYGNFQTLAVNEYTPMIYAAVQQMRSRTERFMRVYGMNSRQRRFQIIDPVSSTQITDLYGATNPQQAEFRQRWLKTKIFKSPHEISRAEMQQAGTIDSPLPRIVDAERMEMQRRRDLVAVEGLIGTAWNWREWRHPRCLQRSGQHDSCWLRAERNLYGIRPDL